MTGLLIGTYVMDQLSDQAITFDVSSWLNPSDVIVALTPELIRISDGVNYTAGLRGSPVVAGQLIAQEVTSLEPGERYYLKLPFSAEGDQVFVPRLEIQCPRL